MSRLSVVEVQVLLSESLESEVVGLRSGAYEWVVDVNAFDVATFHLISRGDCWLHLPSGVDGASAPIPLHEWDLLVLPNNAYHLITYSPDPPREEIPRNTPAETVSGPSATLIC